MSFSILALSARLSLANVADSRSNELTRLLVLVEVSLTQRVSYGPMGIYLETSMVDSLM
jgi:hypothetical protein